MIAQRSARSVKPIGSSCWWMAARSHAARSIRGAAGPAQRQAPCSWRSTRPKVSTMTCRGRFSPVGIGRALADRRRARSGRDSLLETVLEGLTPDPHDGPKYRHQSGRHRTPNVGKSTLINRLLGEDRMVAFDQPGTTRDAVLVPFERDGERYTLIDTAGLRRRSRVEEVVEKFSVIKTLQAIETSHVAVVVMDAHDNVAEQDASLLGAVIEAGPGRGARRQRVGQHSLRTARPDSPAGPAAPAVRRLRSAAFHLRAPRQRRGGIIRRSAQGIRRRYPGHEHPELTRVLESSHREPSTAAGQRPPHQAALRAPGRTQSAGGRNSRQSDRPCAGRIPALPGQCLPQGIRLDGDAGKSYFSRRGKSFCRETKPV